MKSNPFLWAALATCLGCDSGILGGDSKEDDLRDQRRLWVRQGISDYSYDFLRACFCGGPVRPLRIVVRNNAVVSVTVIETGSPPPFIPNGWVGTIDDVFSELQRLFDQDVDDIDLDFDGTFHFPTHADVDRVHNAIDDELVLQLSNFQPMR